MAQVLEPDLEQAKAALDRHAWQEAYDLLTEADARGGLSADELELLAQAAWWVGRLPLSIETRERAYAAYAKAGDGLHAALEAGFLGRDNILRGQHAVATAWLNRAERLLEDKDESPVHGLIAVFHSYLMTFESDLEAAVTQAERAERIAKRSNDPDLTALALNAKGAALVNIGRVREGLALVDESTVQAVAGEVQPQIVGAVYCTTITVCSGLGEWARASQWTEAQDRWCRREGISGFPGICRIHRAEVKRHHGSWLEAEAEARRASEELPGFIPAGVGLALYEIGLIKLRRGDLPAAEEALLRAHAAGQDPEPGLSLLRLAQGRLDAARKSIQRALDAPPGPTSWGVAPGTLLKRLVLLPVQVEIALAGGDVALARKASDELSALVEQYDSLAVRAEAARAGGAVAVAEGRLTEGAAALSEALRLWTELDAPYDAARTRLHLAEALSAEGAPEAAALEIEAARVVFERLGATLDATRAEGTLTSLQGSDDAVAIRPTTERAEMAFMFTDIVDSTRFTELLGDSAWQDVLRWHDGALGTLFAEYAGQEIKRTGDGFFVAFEAAARGIDCAIAVQRRLDQQRRQQGFAPQVRIGLHQAEASRSGLDFIGSGVNEAARIAAAAEGGEILVSATTIRAAGRPFLEAEVRTLTLKGLSAPVAVVAVDWH